MKVFKFAAGLAVGYVLGSRAGRDKYEQIVAAARKAQNHRAVTQAQQKAKELLGTATHGSEVSTDPVLAGTSPTSTDSALPDLESTGTADSSANRPARRRPKSTPATIVESQI